MVFKTAIRYALGVISYTVLLITTPIANLIIPLFTKTEEERDDRRYDWGWIYGTYDNPPQGDRGWILTRSPYPNILTGWRGYVNRVGWMRRNRLYGLKKKLSVGYEHDTEVLIKGDPNISDKYKVAGWMFAVAKTDGDVVAFEWYSVTPWSKRRNLRIRIGWKIKGRKFVQSGDFAPMVFTINPFDGYGS